MKFEDKLRQKCKGIIENIKENPYTWGFSTIILLVVLPLIIWICYFIGDCGFILIRTSLTIDGFWVLYGSFLAFLGTVALGALALWQNKRYQTENNKLNKKLFESQVFMNCAFFKTESCKVIFDEETKRFWFNTYLRNVGKSTAICVLPYEFEFSKFGYRIGKLTDNVVLQIFDKTEANVLPSNLLLVTSNPIEYVLIDGNEYFAHITISIVSENQIQYDQEIQLHLKYFNGKLKYLNEYPSHFLELYDK